METITPTHNPKDFRLNPDLKRFCKECEKWHDQSTVCPMITVSPDVMMVIKRYAETTAHYQRKAHCWWQEIQKLQGKLAMVKHELSVLKKRERERKIEAIQKRIFGEPGDIVFPTVITIPCRSRQTQPATICPQSS